jgi:RNA polymerase sigma factor (sigma-70 family)
MTLKEQEQNLICQNIKFAKKLARYKKKRIRFISLEDLESAAMYGLVQAASRYDPSKNDEFTAYATPRIYGAMSDFVNETLHGPKGKKLNRVPMTDSAYATKETSTETFDCIIQPLSSQTRRILRSHFVEEKKFVEISKDIGVNESRISQIVTEAKKTLIQIWGPAELLSRILS